MDNNIRTDKGQLNNANGGFSLIEVIIAMVILALISIPLINYFTDSIRYSAMMAERQKATVLAQQVTESMKAEDQLIRLVAQSSGDGIYQVPLLTDTVDNGGYGLEMSLDAGSVFESEGQGVAYFTTPPDADNPFGYDIRVTVSTDVAANQVARPLIYGIDDSTDVLSVERDQKVEASVYFMAANGEYCAQNGGSPLSESDILRALRRTMHLNIGYDTAENCFTVKIWYEYTCTGVPILGSGTYVGTYLTDVRMTALSNIYLLYDKNSDGNDSRDDLAILLDSAAANALSAADAGLPELYLICQKVTMDPGYQMYIDQSGSIDQIAGIHSNINRLDMTGEVKLVAGGYETEITPDALTGSGTPTRMVSIVTEVFAVGTMDSGEALAVMEATKGE